MNQILKEQLELIKPSSKEEKEIKEQTKVLISSINKNLKKKKINADVFVGGSVAKNTLIKKKKYDVDIFVRFDQKYDEKNVGYRCGEIAF